MKAFRRACVETEIQGSFQITQSESGVGFSVCGQLVGRIDPEGVVSLAACAESNAGLHHVLVPSNAHNLAEHAYDQLHARLRAEYEVRTGHQLVHDDARGGYYYSMVRGLQGLATRAVKRFCSRIAPDRLAALRHAQLATAHHARLVELVTGPITEAEVRRFYGVTSKRCGSYPGRDALRLILDLPPHLRPVRRRDWQAAFTLHCNLVVAFAHTEYLVGDRKPQVTTLLRGHQIHAGRVGALRHLRDPVPSIASSGRHAGQMLERLMGMTLLQMTSFSEDWHAEVARVTRLAHAEAAQMHQMSGWTGALPSPVLDLPGGMRVRELLTSSELVAEGVMQGHCVASYVGDCYVGRNRILSI